MKKTGVIALVSVCVILLSLTLAGTVAQDETPVSEPGPYQPGIQAMEYTDSSRDDRLLKGFIWYPALVSEDAPRPYPPDASGAPYPLILYSHGFGGSPTESTRLIEHLVSHGFVVAATDHADSQNETGAIVNRPLDMLFILDQLADLEADDRLAELIDTDHVGVSGFSFGGYTTIVAGGARVDPGYNRAWCADHPDVEPDFYCMDDAMWDGVNAYRDQLGLTTDDDLWPAVTDERIRAILPLAPCTSQMFGEAGLAAVSIPTFIVGGSSDASCPFELDARYYYDHLGSADRSLVTLNKRDHGAVIREIPVLQQYATAFFGLHLQGKTDYAQYLMPDTASAYRDVTLEVTSAES